MYRRKKISKSDLELIDQILNIRDDYLFFSLGFGLQYEYAPSGVRYKVLYMKMGKELWRSFKYELYDFLCDRKNEEPKEWLNDLIIGDIRNLAVGIIAVITAEYDVSIAIALPVAALIIKTRLYNYCKTRPKKSFKSVSKILRSQKLNLKNHKNPRLSKKDKKKNFGKTKKALLKELYRENRNNLT